MCAVTVARPNLRVPQAIRFERNPFPVWRKMWPRTRTFLRNDNRRWSLAMFWVPQVQPPEVHPKPGALLVDELMTFGRNGRESCARTDAWHRLWRSSRSRYAPQSRRTGTHGSEHDIATVLSPSRRRIH